jgi:imidazole glycerol-phosphate synthase subunit HisF
MKKNRLIPVLLLKNGWLVQSRGFSRHQNLGNPITSVKRLSKWASDELIYLDISRDEKYDIRRDDLGYENITTFLDIIAAVSKETFMPMTVGGKIKTLKDIEERLKVGADKVAINTAAFKNDGFIENAAKEFGSQCIVASVDVKKTDLGYRVFVSHGQENTNLNPTAWTTHLSNSGVGEILLNSIDNDGVGKGYDLKLSKKISSNCRCPIIACGGAGEWEHFKQILDETNVDAVAAANVFQYMDQSVYLAKKFLYQNNCNVRKPDLLKI